MLTKETTYVIETIQNSDLLQRKLDMNELLNGNMHGFVIEDFLSTDEISSIIAGFRNINDEELTHIIKDFDSYPMTFAQFDQMVNAKLLLEEDYFTISSQFISGFKTRFGVDVFAKMKNTFGHILNSPEICIPNASDSSKPYAPFTFRELFPGEGCLIAHCENLFYEEFPRFFERINTFSVAKNQLSFFIVLQTPGGGGELTLYDLLWQKGQRRLNEDELILSNGETAKLNAIETLKRDQLVPKSGSLVVFSGGEIWHRVEKVKTAPTRITLGGFLSFSKDGQKLYSWS